MAHLSETELNRIATDGLIDPETTQHLHTCEQCSAVASTLRVGSEPSREKSARQRTALDRYEIGRVVGEGAMGRVYEAFDPKLKRRVALKLMRRAANEEARLRLLREAQAAAGLRHPHVVVVYDAGVADDELFIAMEFVAGGTLRQWLQTQPRRWDDVLRVFLEAGSGLAAVHAAGLVHRDFKPDNVLMDERGSPRVSDFGLVGIGQGHGNGPIPALEEEIATLTQAGTLVGTPAYMSPEVLRAAPATPASDQFSFCVALYQALSRQPSFAGKTLAELRAQVSEAHALPPPSGAPRALSRILKRGLSPEPSQRFASMDALLAALSRVPQRRRAVALGVVGAAVAVGLLAASTALKSDPCPPSALGDAWDASRRAEVDKALAAAHATSALQRLVVDELDRYANAWVRAGVEACRDTRVELRQSEAQFAQRMLCLEQRRHELAAVTILLSEPTGELASRATSLTGALQDVRVCADENPTPWPVGDAMRREVLRAQGQLGRTLALLAAGRKQEAASVIEEVDVTLTKLDYRPLLAEARMRRGQVMDHLGDTAGSVPYLKDALSLAIATGRDSIAIRSMELLAMSRASLEPTAADPDLLIDLAISMRARRVPTLQEDEAFCDAVGYVRSAQHRENDSLESYVRSVEVAERSYGTFHPHYGVGLWVVGSTEVSLGRQRKGSADLERALHVLEATYAVGDERLISVQSDRLEALLGLGQVLDAVAVARDIEQRFKAKPEGHDSPHPRHAMGVAIALARAGRTEEALPLARSAHADWLLRRATTLRARERCDSSLMSVLNAAGAFAEARSLAEKSPARERPLVQSQLVRSLLAAGRLDEAVAVATRMEPDSDVIEAAQASAMRSAAMVRATHWVEAEKAARDALDTIKAWERIPELRATLGTSLAESQVGLGDFAQALASAEEARRQCDLITPQPGALIARADFARAQASWASQKKSEARTLAEGSRIRLAAAGRPEEHELERVVAWLATHQ